MTQEGLDFYNRQETYEDANSQLEFNEPNQRLPVMIGGHLRNAAYANIDPRTSSTSRDVMAAKRILLAS